MTREDYLRLSAEIRKRYANRLRELADEIGRDQDALKRVWTMAHPTEPPPSEAPVSSGSVNNRGIVEYTVQLVICMAIPPGQTFTIRDVMRELETRMGVDEIEISIHRESWRGWFKQVSVSSVLQRFADSGYLEIVEVGKGRRASSYRIPDNDTTRARYEDYQRNPVSLIDPDSPGMADARASAEQRRKKIEQARSRLERWKHQQREE